MTVLRIDHQYYQILAANQVVIFPSSVSWHTYKIAAVTSSISYLTARSDCLFVFHNVIQYQTVLLFHECIDGVCVSVLCVIVQSCVTE